MTKRTLNFKLTYSKEEAVETGTNTEHDIEKGIGQSCTLVAGCITAMANASD